jgi:hypothetical protein
MTEAVHVMLDPRPLQQRRRADGRALRWLGRADDDAPATLRFVGEQSRCAWTCSRPCSVGCRPLGCRAAAGSDRARSASG